MAKGSDSTYFQALRQVWLAMRELTGETQRAAAEEMELEPSLLSKWERGETTRLQDKTHEKLVALLQEWNNKLPPEKRLELPSRQSARDLAAHAALLPMVGAIAGGPTGLALGAAVAAVTLERFAAFKKKNFEKEAFSPQEAASSPFICPYPDCANVVPGPAEGAKFCVSCGRPFALECPQCKMLCPIVDAKFCPNCGTALCK